MYYPSYMNRPPQMAASQIIQGCASNILQHQQQQPPYYDQSMFKLPNQQISSNERKPDFNYSDIIMSRATQMGFAYGTNMPTEPVMKGDQQSMTTSATQCQNNEREFYSEKPSKQKQETSEDVTSKTTSSSDDGSSSNSESSTNSDNSKFTKSSSKFKKCSKSKKRKKSKTKIKAPPNLAFVEYPLNCVDPYHVAMNYAGYYNIVHNLNSKKKTSSKTIKNKLQKIQKGIVKNNKRFQKKYKTKFTTTKLKLTPEELANEKRRLAKQHSNCAQCNNFLLPALASTMKINPKSKPLSIYDSNNRNSNLIMEGGHHAETAYLKDLLNESNLKRTKKVSNKVDKNEQFKKQDPLLEEEMQSFYQEDKKISQLLKSVLKTLHANFADKLERQEELEIEINNCKNGCTKEMLDEFKDLCGKMEAEENLIRILLFLIKKVITLKREITKMQEQLNNEVSEKNIKTAQGSNKKTSTQLLEQMSVLKEVIRNGL